MNPGEILFERFKLDSKLGEGGMGVVWRAYDSRLEQRVALKFLPSGLADDPSAVALLKHEAQKAIQLTHPHIVRVHDLHIAQGFVAVAMEWIDGSTMHQLQRFTRTGVFQPGDLPILLQQFISALSYAHEKRGMIHRDLKPANLMINREGELKIADFGIAAPAHSSATKMRGLSGSGTPAYMSPQQVMGEPPHPTDDIYSFGATLYDLLTGAPPFFEDDILEQLFKKNAPRIEERRVEFGINNPAINPNWEAVIASCLAKNPADRPQTVKEIGIRLRLADLAVLGNSAGHLQQLVSHHFDNVDRQEQRPRQSRRPAAATSVVATPDSIPAPANPPSQPKREAPSDPGRPQPSVIGARHPDPAAQHSSSSSVPTNQAVIPPPQENPELHYSFAERCIALTAYPISQVKAFARQNRSVSLTAFGIVSLLLIFFCLRPSDNPKAVKPVQAEPASMVQQAAAPVETPPEAASAAVATAVTAAESGATPPAQKASPGPFPFSQKNTASFGPANNIVRLIDDPKHSRLYALQQNGSDDGVIFVLDPLTYEAITALQVGPHPTDMSLGSDRDELLVICATTKSICVVDLPNLKVTTVITLPEYGEHDDSISRVHLKHGPGDIIYYTDGAWAPVLRVFSRNSGKVVQSVLLDGNKPNNSGAFGFGDFVVTPDKKALFAWGQYGWNAGSAGSNVARFKINPNGTLVRTQTGSLSYPAFLRDPLDTPALISATGDRVFLKQHQFASISIAGPVQSLPSAVYAISSRGEIAVTTSEIYATATGEKIYDLPSKSSVQAISADNSRLIFFDPTTRQLMGLDLSVALRAESFDRDPSASPGKTPSR